MHCSGHECNSCQLLKNRSTWLSKGKLKQQIQETVKETKMETKLSKFYVKIYCPFTSAFSGFCKHRLWSFLRKKVNSINNPFCKKLRHRFLTGSQYAYALCLLTNTFSRLEIKHLTNVFKFKNKGT